jgi:hypothetical protein
MQGQRKYSFKMLGTANTTVSGTGSGSVQVSLPLPADFYTHELAKAEMALDFAYSSGFGPGSQMNVMLNGEFIHGVAFTSPDGAALQDYRISLPARALVPGINRLDFNITSRAPPAPGDCSVGRGRDLMVQILESSAITLPEAGHVATLPNLSLFAGAGFPFVTVTHDAPALVSVANPRLIGSALTLIGKIAQVAHAPLSHWSIGVGVPEKLAEHAILLATPEDLKGPQFQGVVDASAKAMQWPYRSLNDLRAATDQRGVSLDSLLPAMLGENSSEKNIMPDLTLSQRSGLGPVAVLTALRNKDEKSDQTLLLLLAATPERLTERVEQLVRPDFWAQIKGDLTVWQDRSETMFSIDVGEHYQVGERNRWLLLRATVSNNPLYWLSAMLGGLVLFALLAAILLRRRHRKLHQGGK